MILMDDKSIPGLISQLLPDAGENDPEREQGLSDPQTGILLGSLKALAGQSGGAAAEEISEFLGGKGALHETTRAAMARGSASAQDELSALLINKFKLSPTIASVIAGLLVRLLPSIGKEAPARKKPRRKARPKTASSAKTDAASKKKKSKKKATTKPKASASKPAAAQKPRRKSKPKTAGSSKTGKKESTSTTKPKKAKRATALEEA
jgi:hypothetical protein